MAQSTNAVSDTILITRLKLNTKESEYSPYLFREKLYFVSNRPTQFGVVVWDQNFNVPSKIFEMQRKDSLRFFQVRTEKKLNPTLNSGPLTIGMFGIYFTSKNKPLSKNFDAGEIKRHVNRARIAGTASRGGQRRGQPGIPQFDGFPFRARSGS